MRIWGRRETGGGDKERRLNELKEKLKESKKNLSELIKKSEIPSEEFQLLQLQTSLLYELIKAKRKKEGCILTPPSLTDAPIEFKPEEVDEEIVERRKNIDDLPADRKKIAETMLEILELSNQIEQLK